MNGAQKAAVERGEERGTQRQRNANMLMQSGGFNLTMNNIHPIFGLRTEFQPEHILFCLCVGAEARGEPKEGIERVACVIMNRWLAQREYFGKTIRDVILKHNTDNVYQFSAMHPENINRKWMIEPDASSWIRVVKIALPFYLSKRLINPKGMFYYVSDKIEPPKWTENLVEHIHIGGHRFYKEI